jgi:Cu/Ag efflux pump CusA
MNPKLYLPLILAVVLFPSVTYAYIDPGTGSYILQVLAAVLLGGLFAIKMFWLHIKGFFLKFFTKKK